MNTEQITVEMRMDKLKEDIRELVEEFHLFEPNYMLSIDVSESRTHTICGKPLSSFDIKVFATLER
jgi:hypothetical protein